MAFESQGDTGYRVSPGGFEFGTQGFSYGPPVPKSMTFFTDGSCLVSDQYGRHVRCAVLPDGSVVMFADSPPESNRDGEVVPRPQFATHQQVIAALTAERIDWLAYEVKYVTRDGTRKAQSGLSREAASTLQAKLIRDGNRLVSVDRMIACAGWPQLPYAELKNLPELPPTPLEELRKIRDPQLRKDALRARREADDVRARETQASEVE